MRMLAHLIGAAVVVVVGTVGPALADCYDILGCTDRDLFSKHFEYLGAPHPTGPNCNFLWVMRNSILRQHGYCFHTHRRAKAAGSGGLRA
jgi:YARHG domain